MHLHGRPAWANAPLDAVAAAEILSDFFDGYEPAEHVPARPIREDEE